MSASRNFTIELTQEQRECESIRVAFGVWNDIVYALCDSAYQLRAIGEERQCEAMLIDAESMCRRARLHIGNMAARERVKLEAQLTEQQAGDAANNQHTKESGAA